MSRPRRPRGTQSSGRPGRPDPAPPRFSVNPFRRRDDRPRWSLRRQITWVPDAERTSVPAVMVTRVTVVLYVLTILGQVIGNAVVAVSNVSNGSHAGAHLNDWKLPWELGLAFALVPAVCLLRYGANARRGSARFNVILLSVVIAAFCWRFTSPYFALLCAADLVLFLVLLAVDKSTQRRAGRSGS